MPGYTGHLPLNARGMGCGANISKLIRENTDTVKVDFDFLKSPDMHNEMVYNLHEKNWIKKRSNEGVQNCLNLHELKDPRSNFRDMSYPVNFSNSPRQKEWKGSMAMFRPSAGLKATSNSKKTNPFGTEQDAP